MTQLPRTERGAALTVFVATVMLALLIGAGLVVDGGRRAAATRECQAVAAEAARAAVNAGALAVAAGTAPDQSAMRQAALRVVASHPGMSATVTLGVREASVTTQVSTSTVFLSLIGIRSLTADGRATASLRGVRAP